MIETSVLIAGVITGLTACVKQIGCPSQWLPIVAVVIGGVLGYLIMGHDVVSVVTGLFTGLVTQGLVSRVDHVVEKIG